MQATGLFLRIKVAMEGLGICAASSSVQQYAHRGRNRMLVSDRSAGAAKKDLDPALHTEVRWVCRPRAGQLGVRAITVKGMMNWAEACRRQWIDVTSRDYVKATVCDICISGPYKRLPPLMESTYNPFRKFAI